MIQTQAENIMQAQQSAELKGARTERAAIKRFIMRESNFTGTENIDVALTRVLAFIAGRKTRYDAKPGGLQGRKVKAKK